VLGGECKLEDFDLSDILGHGNFGVVRRAVHRPSDHPVAIKFLQHDHEDWYLFNRNEECIHSELRFPFIPALYCTIVQDQVVAYVMELVDGVSLSHVIKGKDAGELKVEDLDLPKLMAQLLVTLEYIHSHDIVMADLTCRNLLITKDGRDLKLIDFGLSIKTLDDGQMLKAPEWVAHRILPSLGNNPAVDWYSYGLILYEILHGEDPFEQLVGPNRLRSPLIRGQFCPSSFSKNECDFIKRFSAVEWENAWGSKLEDHQEMRHHPWFQGFDWDALDKFLKKI
jgi:serine/threonine protein kinase